jgi:hypothetical protein
MKQSLSVKAARKTVPADQSAMMMYGFEMTGEPCEETRLSVFCGIAAHATIIFSCREVFHPVFYGTCNFLFATGHLRAYYYDALYIKIS